jgi:F-type H+-transporting ATPase subunit alpha
MIVRVAGLAGAATGELVECDGGGRGVVLALGTHDVTVALFDGRGGRIVPLGRRAEVPVGPATRGRVIDPIGRPLDGRPLEGPTRPVASPPPGVCDRAPLGAPIHAGVKAVDALVPIRRGAVATIDGPPGSGRTDLARTIVLAQPDTCFIAGAWPAIEHATVVTTPPDATPALRMLAPAAAMAMAEAVRDAGGDALVVIDDLASYAAAVRAVIAGRDGVEPVAEEIFAAQAALLARAGPLAKGGSITVVAIGRAGSVADRVIELDAQRFRIGVRPAIVPPTFTSKVGSDCSKAVRPIAGKLRLALMQFRELAGASEETREVREAVRRGERVIEILKQPASSAVSELHEVAALMAAAEGMLDALPVGEVAAFERELVSRLPSDMRPDARDEMLAIARRLSHRE